MEAGYAPDGINLGPDQDPDYMFTLEQAKEHVESMPWPAFVLDAATFALSMVLVYGVSREAGRPSDACANSSGAASTPSWNR